jgi:hypothetical protein
MKIMYDRKVAHAKRRKRFDKLVEKIKKQEEAAAAAAKKNGEIDNDNNNTDSESSSFYSSSSSSSSSSNSANSSRSNLLNKDKKKKKNAKEQEYIYIQRQDWNEAPLVKGNWCLVYPCKAFPHRSPYRSALGDLRAMIKAVEQYLSVAESVTNSFPEQNDAFYESKVKALCGWNIEIWCPPGEDKEDTTIVPILR